MIVHFKPELQWMMTTVDVNDVYSWYEWWLHLIEWWLKVIWMMATVDVWMMATVDMCMMATIIMNDGYIWN